MECTKLLLKLEDGLELEILDVPVVDHFVALVYQLGGWLETTMLAGINSLWLVYRNERN